MMVYKEVTSSYTPPLLISAAADAQVTASMALSSSHTKVSCSSSTDLFPSS